ncbi:MAG: alpha/beta hydrolase [Jatrophihabitantaceae bacterium]|nr:alpha/beta hydrolase [Jatrophihabitantaceae bacterium]
MTDLLPLDPSVLPDGVRSRFAPDVNGLRIHFLEAGFETPGRPCVLLVHGFPELAYSWRKVMPLLAAAGYHVIAPDVRGYGRTTGWDVTAASGRAAFGMLTSVVDATGLINALGHRTAAVIGHDYGSSVAAWCALSRPDVFTAVAMMSAPFGGGPRLPFGTLDASPAPRPSGPDIHSSLAALDRPRKIYTWYYSGDDANDNMTHAPQGLPAFLRAYYHHKSADWDGNKPFRLASYTADQLALMPTYYIMDLAAGMAETVAAHMPTPAEVAAATWLPDAELAVYAEEYGRTTFRGGLEWYRRGTGGLDVPSLELFAGRTIDQPSIFIAGASDWGVYQNPGAVERMEQSACTQMRGVHLIDGAGHWVQQEQPEATAHLLIGFLKADYRPSA